MKSMTGFASGTSKNKKFEIKIKSVNNRFFEFKLYAPLEVLTIEADIKKIIQTHVHRGSVDAYVQYVKQGALHKNQDFSIDFDVAKNFVKQTQAVAKKLKLKSQVEIQDVLKYSGAVKTKFEDEALNPKQMLEDFKSIIKQFDKERLREGQALKKEILDLLSQLETTRKQLMTIAEKLPDDIHKRLQDKIKNFKGDVDQGRLDQEILFFIDRADIKEELVRLKEHIRGCKELLDSGQPEGKKLDFYAQELFREMNTVGSKSSSVQITAAALQGKAIIEKIRQQVQNIE